MRNFKKCSFAFLFSIIHFSSICYGGAHKSKFVDYNELQNIQKNRISSLPNAPSHGDLFSEAKFVDFKAPLISLDLLFSDLVISTEYLDWKIYIPHSLIEWPREMKRQNSLSRMQRNFDSIYAPLLFPEPIVINEDNKEFFKNLSEKDYPRDGTASALIYALVPELLLSSEVNDNLGQPILFYLIKKNSDLEIAHIKTSKTFKEVYNDLENRIIVFNKFHKAKSEFTNKNFEKASLLFEELSKSDVPYAYFMLANILEYGQGIDIDLKEAFNYYKLAADEGHIKSQFKCGDLYLNGNGCKKNIIESEKYLKSSSDQGFPKAQALYNLFLLDYKSESENIPEIIKNLKLLADQGDFMAQRGCCLYFANHGIRKNIQEVKKYCKLSANRNDGLSQFYYGLTFLSKNRSKEDCKKAKEYFRLAEENFCLRAEIMLLIDFLWERLNFISY